MGSQMYTMTPCDIVRLKLNPYKYLHNNTDIQSHVVYEG